MKTLVTLGILSLALLAGCQAPPPPAAQSAVSSAEANCLAAVAQQTNAGGVTTKSVTPAEAGTSVMVNVPGATAPWVCATDAAGKVTNVMFSGEG